MSKERLKELVSWHDHTILDEIKWRVENREQIRKAQALAIALCRCGLSDSDLALLIGCSLEKVKELKSGKMK